MFTEGALIELAIKGIGGMIAAIVAVVGIWWGGKRSGRKQIQHEIEKDRHDATLRHRDAQDSYSRDVKRARDRVRDSAIDK